MRGLGATLPPASSACESATCGHQRPIPLLRVFEGIRASHSVADNRRRMSKLTKDIGARRTDYSRRSRRGR